ncbi:MAG: sterol desaturase family protein [Chitinophagales bacterium]|nr:sterol desaturase family protein [Chitinophagales bacterium]
MKWLSKIWNYDFRFSGERFSYISATWVVLIALCLVFGFFDLTMDTAAGFYHDVLRWVGNGDRPFKNLSDQQFERIGYAALAVLFVYIAGLALLSFRKSYREHGPKEFAPIFWAHFLSNVVGMAGTFLFFALLGGIAYALGFTYDDGTRAIQAAVGNFETWVKEHIPTLVNVPYPFAILGGVFIGALPGYFVHWLCHKSRLLWYLSHRCHHTAEIMHPAGIGPFMFLPEIFSAIPGVLLSAAASKLFYFEAMTEEAFILAFFGILTEKFNHNSAFYDFAHRNIIVRQLSHYYGNGVYHYTHHTSKQGDEIVNVGGNPWMIWDRIFGTYRIPPKEAPKVGLTNNPIIRLSPFKIMFSGFEQIAYELRMNKSWLVRFKILFGDIYYKPPISKDYLIVGYREAQTNDTLEAAIVEAQPAIAQII